MERKVSQPQCTTSAMDVVNCCNAVNTQRASVQKKSLLWTIIVSFLVFGMLAMPAGDAMAQCANDNNFDNTRTPSCGSNLTESAGAGTYVNIPVTQGANYRIRLESIPGAWSGGRITLFNNTSGSSLGTAGTTGATTSELSYTSSFTGTLRVGIDRNNCDACSAGNLAVPTNCPSLGSAVLRFRQDAVSLTGSTADMCQGQSRTLSANYGYGSWSGTNVSDNTGSSANGTFTAPTPSSTSQNYTQTYSLDECAPTQTITVYHNPSTANAGSDQSVCGTSTTLSASNPTYGAGIWALTAGSGTIANPTSTTTTVTGLSTTTTNTFRWRVSSGACGNSDDFVNVTATAIPSNNTCANAIARTAGTYSWDNSCATTSLSTSCGGSNDIWYKYTAPCDGEATFELCGTPFDVVITAFSSCGGGEVECNDDACGLQSRITPIVTGGQTYYIRVASFSSTVSGSGTLTILDPPIPYGTAISGPSTVCPQATQTYTASATGAYSYQWAYPAGVSGPASGSSVNVSFPLTSGSSYTLTVTPYNDCGLAGASDVHTVTPTDNSNPTINCPSNINTTTNGACGLAVSYSAPSASDNCSVASNTRTAGLASGSFFPVGTTTVTYVATDPIGNSSQCSFTVSVADDDNPTISCPSNITVNNDGGSCTALVNYTTPSGSDNCSGQSTAQIAGLSSGSSFPYGTTTNTFRVTDAAGNTAQCSFAVTVNDNENPQVICPSNITVNNDAGQCSAVVDYAVPVGTDNCPGATTVLTGGLGDFGTFPVGTTTESYQVTDHVGLTHSCSFTVTVNDNENPVAKCNNPTVQLNAAGSGSLTAAQVDNSSTDNCGVASTSINVTSFDCSDVGANSVTLTVTDAAGNSSTCVSTVSVEDNVAPSASCTGTTVQLSSGGSSGPNNTVLIINDGGAYTSTLSTALTNAGYTVTTTSEPAYNGANPSPDTYGAVIHMNGPTFGSAMPAAGLAALSNYVNTVGGVYIHDGMVSYTYSASLPVAFTQIGVYTGGSFLNTLASAVGHPVLAGVPTSFIQNPGQFIKANPNAGFTPLINTPQAGTDGVFYNDTYASGGSVLGFNHTGNGTSGGFTAWANADIQTIVINAISLGAGGGGGGGGAAGTASITANDVDNGSTDACGVATTDVSPSDFDCSDIGANTVTLTVTDVNGNSSTCTATITVEDVDAPTAACQDVTIQLDASGNTTETAASLGALMDDGSDDVCGIDTYTASPSAFTCANVGANTVTLTVADPSGNTDACTATVTVQDNVAPNASCQNVSVNLDASGNATVSAASVDNSSSDACGIASLALSPNSFTCSEVGGNTATLTVTDNNGNSSTCTATITVNDVTAPTAVCQDITVLLDISGSATADPNDADNGSSDACGVSFSLSQTNFTCSELGSNAETLTVTDPSGNSSTCTLNVEVVDPIPPTIECPGDITQNADNGVCTAAVTVPSPGSNDNCLATGSTIVNDYNGTDDATDTYPVGTTTVMWVLTDIGGNSDTCYQTITVIDNQDPTYTCPATYAHVTDPGDCNGTVTTDLIVTDAADNCGIASIVNDYNNTDNAGGGTNYPIGTTVVTWTVTDDNGNAVNCTQLVTIADLEDPVITCPMDITQNQDFGVCEAIVLIGTATATDNCGILAIANDHNSPVFPVGTTTVTWTAVDVYANTSTCTQDITVLDVTDPYTICKDYTSQLNASGNSSITPANVDAGSTDECGIASLAVSPNAFTCSNVGANTVTLTATDNNGNSATCTATVTVEDNVKPVALCKDLTIQLDANGDASIDSNAVDNGSSDACGIASIIVAPNTFNCTNVGANGVVQTVTDVNGNTSTCNATVTVEDNVPPTPICKNITVQLDASGNESIVAAQVDNGSNDACGVATLAVSPNSFTCGEVGPNTVTLTVTDVNSNVATCTSTVTVQDLVPPVALCQDVVVQLDNTPAGGGTGSTTAAAVDAGSNDACGIASVTLSQTTFTCADLGATTETLTVTDVNGNVTTCTATVTTEDNFDPSITCPADINTVTSADGSGNCNTAISVPAPTTDDNCTVAAVKNDYNNTSDGSDVYYAGVHVVEWTVVDQGGLSVSCTHTITVVDDENPSITCATDIIQDADPGVCDAAVVVPAPATADNCGVDYVQWSLSGATTGAANPSADASGTYNLGVTTVSYTVWDTTGNSAQCSMTVTIRDAENPTISCPADITQDTDLGVCDAAVTIPLATASDNCISLEITNDYNAGGADASDTYPLGITIVEYTVTDTAGNTAVCVTNITIEDNEFPTITCPADITQTADPAECNADVTVPQPAFADNCSANILNDYNSTDNATDNYPVGTTTVEWTVTDTAGNAVTCTHDITITDDEDPTITCSADIVVDNDLGVCGAIVDYVSTVGSDNCPGAVITQTGGLGDAALFPAGTTTEAYLITDASGNTATCSFTVTVNDAEAPVLACTNITQDTDPGECEADVNINNLTATDNCVIASITNDYNGTSDASDTYQQGVTTVIWTVVDTSGNSSTCSFEVNIEDNEAPTITCPYHPDGGIFRFAPADSCATYITVRPPQATGDNCGIASVLNSVNGTSNASNVYSAGLTRIDWTITDLSGNSTVCTDFIFVVDTLPPTTICNNVTTYLDANGNVGITTGDVDAGSSDNCGISFLTLSDDDFTCADVGTNNVTLTAIDTSGNSGTCISVVSVFDTIMPTALCRDITVQLDSGSAFGDGAASIVAGDVNNGSFDNCGIGSMDVTPKHFACVELGANTVTLTVEDNNGNVSACTSTVTVEDNIAPVAVCNDLTLQLDAAGQASVTGIELAGASDDNCLIVSSSVLVNLYDCSDVGANPVVVSMTDQSGNLSTCNSVITVVDGVDPVAICQNVTIQLDATGNASVTAAAVDNGSNDACGIDGLSLSQTDFVCAEVGANAVVLTATDDNGNSSTCNATVTVEDNVNPVAVCTNITVQLDVSGNASIVGADVDNGSNDACGVASLTASPNSFTCANVGTNTVTLTATDNNGNSSTCTGAVTIQDNVDPVALCQDVTVQLDANGNGSITTGDVNNGSSDACGIASLSLDETAFDCAEVGGNTVILTVTDNNGNSSTCSSAITVEDNIDPIALCQDLTIQLSAATNAGAASITPNDIDDGSNDACGIASLTLDESDFDCSEVGANTVVLTATDNNGNSSTCSATVTVQDNIAPTAVCQDVTIQLSSATGAGAASITTGDVDGGSSDNCGIASLVLDETDFDCSNVGSSNTVVLTVTDVNGNVSNCSATITVEDLVDPVAVCQAITIQLDAGTNNSDGAASYVAADIDGGSTDNCAVASISATPTAFDCGDVGLNGVTLTVTDVNGNVSSCNTTVTVQDNVDPVAVCQNLTIQLDAGTNNGDGSASITPAQVDNGSSDNCSVASLSLNESDFDCSEVGNNTVVLTVLDVNGNSSTCSATITVEDNVDPVAVCQNVTIQLDAGTNNGDGSASITTANIDAGSSDNCGVASLALDDTDFGCGDVGANTVTLTVTDVNGNVSTCTATVTVQDNVNPVAVCQPITVQLDAGTNNGDGAVSIVPGDIDNGSSDNCAVASLVLDDTGFDCGDVGLNLVNLTVTDVNGNSSNCSALVTVEDNVDPVAVCQDITIQLDASGDASIVAGDIDGGSSDNCSVAGLAASQTDFDCSHAGSNNVTLTVTDVNGNSSTCLAIVSVEDNVDPTITCAPAQTQTADAGVCQAAVTVVGPTFADACAVSVVNDYNNTADASDTYLTGPTLVTWTATDASGNAVSCTQLITVTDDEDPTITCPADQVQSADPGVCDANVTIAIPLTADNCGVDVLTNDYNGTSDASDNYPVGVTTVTYTVADTSGNTVTCSFTVDINDEEVPTITCAPDQNHTSDPGVCEATVSVTGPATADNCVIASVLNDWNGTTDASDTYPVGINQVTWTVTDTAGNSSICVQLINVFDNEDPTITCPSDITQTADAGVCNAYVLVPTPVTGDNCAVSNWTNGYNAGPDASDTYPVGTTNVVFTVFDESGNFTTCDFNITITDNENPTITCVDQAQTADPGECEADVVVPAPATGDNCAVANINNDYNNSDNASDTYIVGVTTFTWTVTDIHGNSSSCQQTITITDDENPSITCAADQTQTADAGVCQAAVVVVGPATDDNCAVATVVNDFNGTSDASDTYIVGTTTVTWTVTDIHGNSSQCTQDITVTDDENPSITCAADQTQTADAGVCQAAVVVVSPATDDNCAVATVVNDFNGTSDASDTYIVGTTTVTWTVTDIHGNSSQCTQDITVTDDENPSITCAADQTQTADAGVCQAAVVVVGPATDDNCAVAAVKNDYNNTADASDTYLVGPTIVTWTVTDIHGNSSQCTQLITVTDDEDPTITCPADITQTADAGVCEAAVSVPAPATADNCGVNTVTNDYNGTSDASDTYIVGTTTVEFTVTDTSGNFSTCTFDITIRDDENPIIFDCPADIAIVPDSNDCSPKVLWVEPTTTDNCAVASFVSTHQPADRFSEGTTTVTYTSTDIYGNFSICEFDVTITPKPLQISLTPDVFECGYNVTCNGSNDGALDLYVQGGCLPYTYNWSGPGTINGQEDQSALVAGAYSVTVTGDNGRTATASITLTEPDVLAKTAVLSQYECGYNVTCNGAADGSIDVTVTGGAACEAYTFVWFTPNGSGIVQGAEDQSGLTAGIYKVNITDANGCVTIGTYFISEPDELVITSITSPTLPGGNNISCNGAADGSIDLTAADGNDCQAYSYAWTGPNGFTANTEDLSGLEAGTYDVTVTDVSGCSTTGSITLTEPDELLAGICEDQEVVLGYYPENIALITTDVTGGVAGYTYAWSTGETTDQITVAPTATTTYSVTVTDVNGCTVAESHTVTVVDVRCGSKLDRVEMCDGNKTKCVKPNDVPKKLCNGWTLGGCSTNVDLDPGTCGDPELLGCTCEGGLTQVTFEYIGTSGVDINVYAKKNHDDLLASFSNVQNGDLIVIDGSTYGNYCKLNKETWVEVVGFPDIILDTECGGSSSKSSNHSGGTSVSPGDTIGDFVAVAWEDQSGAVCDDRTPDCAVCHPSGHIKLMTVVYRGADGATINALDNPQGNIFQTWTNVQQGDTLLVNGTLQNGSRLDYLTSFEVVGSSNPDAVIPTDCANGHGADNIGRIYGDFLVTGLTDVKDNSCGMDAPCPCDGGMAIVGVIYNGPAGETVRVWYKSSHNSNYLLGEFANLQPGDTITVNAQAINKSKLDKETYFEIVGSGVSDTEIPTDCKTYVQDQEFGAFTVFGYIDKERNLCNMVEPPKCACNGGIAQLTVEYDAVDALSLTDTTVIFYADAAHTDTIGIFTDVSSGDVLNVDASGLAGGVFPSIIYIQIEGVNRPDTKVPTACPATDLVGSSINEIFVVGYEDAAGNVCSDACDIGYTLMCHHPTSTGSVGTSAPKPAHTHCVKNKDVNKKLQKSDWTLGPCPTNAKLDGGFTDDKDQVMLRAYPNPFDKSTTISFRLPTEENARLLIFNLAGGQIGELFNERADAGREYKVEFTPETADGMYFYRLITESGEVYTEKIVQTK